MKRWYALCCGRERTGSHSGRIRVQTSRWSSASTTGIAAAPASSSPTSSSRASAGHGEGSAGARSARRSSESRSMTMPCSTANRAARSARSGSRAGSAPASRCSSPSRRTTPSPSARSRRPRRPIGPRNDDRTRRQASSLVHAIARAALAMPAISASPFAKPSASATASCSCSASTFPARPVRRCSSTRASSSMSYARARLTSSCSRRMARAACAQCSECTSRRPPRPSLRSGSSMNATSPACAWRASTRAASSSSQRFERRSHCDRAAVLRSAVSAASPAMWRALSNAVAESRSLSASSSASRCVQTLWPSFIPASQIGYHTRSDTAFTSRRGLRRSITSRSLCGQSSARPYPPTATSDIPTTSDGCPESSAWPSSEASQSSTSAV